MRSTDHAKMVMLAGRRKDAVAERDEIAAGVPQPNRQEELLALVLSVYRYRHLLENLRQHRERNTSIITRRNAAVLAWLWATEELNLPNSPQKEISHDLDMGASEVGNALRIFLDNGLVVQIETLSRREKIYEITDAGKDQLNLWLRTWAGQAYIDQVQKIDMPDLQPAYQLLTALKEQISRELRASRR